MKTLGSKPLSPNETIELSKKKKRNGYIKYLIVQNILQGEF